MGIGVNHGTGKTYEDRNAIARRIAKFFHAGDIINLGVGVPLLVGNYTEPDVLVHCENGCIGVGELLDKNDPTVSSRMNMEPYRNAGSQPFIPIKGAMVCDHVMSYAIIRRGIIDATVLGCFEVSETGDLANWFSPGKIAGMGGAMDLCQIPTVIIATTQVDKKGAPKLVKKCTLPLTAKGRVSKVVTERAYFEFVDGKLYLREIREGYDLEDIKNNTEADFIVPEDLLTNVVF